MSNQILWDCHMHSSFSADSDTSMEDMIREAICRGLTGFCFTEQLDPDYPPTPDNEIFELDLDGYRETLFRLREKYQKELQIHFGIELGLQPHLHDYFHELLATMPFDFVIGSSHVVHGYDPYYMGAVTETLFESELFGHVKGAFTDAKADRSGKFEAADGGSLFLDEIGNLSYPLQAKLLSALQTRHITRVGSNKSISVDIRLISATNKNLFKSVKKGEFREDLLYRINTIHLEVPPLRERREDIPQLADFFLRRLARKYGKSDLKLGEKALCKLESYAWPGNVRELEHAIEKAVILSDNQELQPNDFYMRTPDETSFVVESFTLEEMEKILIEKALRKYDNNISAVAAELGISRPTLYSKIRKYEL